MDINRSVASISRYFTHLFNDIIGFRYRKIEKNGVNGPKRLAFLFGFSAYLYIMNGRENRFRAIRKIITEYRVSSQDQLLHRLEAEGVKITQATLSRDLKVLKVGKVPDEAGEYYYVLTENDGNLPQGYIDDFKRGYLSLTFSQNLGVIKTLQGHADTVAIALDRLDLPEVLGTIAGDDTILVILKENENRDSFTKRLFDLMGDLEAL